jgi:hypothetical protein
MPFGIISFFLSSAQRNGHSFSNSQAARGPLGPQQGAGLDHAGQPMCLSQRSRVEDRPRPAGSSSRGGLFCRQSTTLLQSRSGCTCFDADI